MTPKLTGQRITRVNDYGPLHGTGRYVDDLNFPNMLHAAVIRSPVAHGKLQSFDASSVPTGVEIFDPDRILSAAPRGLPVVWEIGDQDQHATPLVDDHLRYVGQPIGLVVAASRYVAEDAAERVHLEIEELEPVADIGSALAAESPLLYPERGSNVLASFTAGDPPEHTQAIFEAADHVAGYTVEIGRVHGLSLEPRGVVAVPEPRGKLTLYSSTQAPHSVRDSVCEVLNLTQGSLRVVAPEVGGGFGLKDHAYEDEIMVALAAIQLDCPVKWIEDRLESFIATTHARDEIHHVEVAFDNDGTLRGLRVNGNRNAGARFAIFGGGSLFTTFGVVPGPYKWEAVSCTGHLVATNTMSTGAYRGFGQTQAALIRERAVDLVAMSLGKDPVEVRAQNMIGAEELPYQIRTFIEFDNGDYKRALKRAAELIDQSPAPIDQRRRGTGFCSYVQMAGIGPSNANEAIGLKIGGFETANIRLEPDGTTKVATGVSPHGQGLETTIPQLVADELGLPLDSVELICGDTDTTPYSSYGTAASRSIAVGGGAAVIASRLVAEKIKAIAAEILEAAPADIELSDGSARVLGTNVSVPIADVAKRAWQGFRLPEGFEPGLTGSHSYDPLTPTFSYATHACRVAVDMDTGAVEVEDYVVVHDCGTIVNPTIVEGQIHGGVAQGLGAALMESMVYDTNGQPQSSTMLDYHVPVSASIPEIRIEHLETPSPHTPGGMKGMGEGGTNGAYAAVVNAIINALPEVDWSEFQTPLTPATIWEAINGSR